jgi:hypothetical protein
MNVSTIDMPEWRIPSLRDWKKISQWCDRKLMEMGQRKQSAAAAITKNIVSAAALRRSRRIKLATPKHQ